MAAKKVIIADLDARTVNIEKKLEEVTRMTKEAGQRMEGAFNRIAAVTEKSMNRSSLSMNNFSKGDLKRLAAELALTADMSGKFNAQLSSLASGLLTGGAIGAAVITFTTILSLLRQESEKTAIQIGNLKGEVKDLIDVTLPSGGFRVKPEDIPEAIELLKQELELQKEVGKNWLKENPLGIQVIALEEAIKVLEEANQKFLGRQDVIGILSKSGLVYTEKIETSVSKTTQNLVEQVNAWDTIGQIIENDIYKRLRELDDELVILDDYKKSSGEAHSKFGPSSSIGKAGGALELSLDRAADPMKALVSLSNQMASNFQFAGHTFVGQLSQSIAMIDSISNMILTVASMFGSGGGGFGIGGLLSLIGLEKGGRVTNLHGAISYTKIPSFAAGGSYSTPGFNGPMGGGYPVMVHKNETLDVYNAGQTSRMERTLGEIKTILYNTGVNASRKRGGGGPIVIKIGDKTIAEVTQKRINKMNRAGVNLEQL